ncbi:class I SAM-dependent methyltransferase [Leptolyngbya sp. PCC 6406]|uniref:class I SAM-dependent methyltransferase n=1 Tax=Leptolyngbya sp. PCC 6406 TaxID=1173264 RepID=UPI0002AC028E|nr:class I SAM-dependent methyltransferase [Leptolyngbya sp. PCC 6406]
MGLVADRFDREYRGQVPDIPDSVQTLPVFQAWATGHLSAQIASPFWTLAKPQKRQTCLDLGCGASFLVYPWREWDARFYGQDISGAICQMVNSRGPQLNSKLFKGMKQAPAHKLEDYEPEQFDLVISTGVTCYYSLDYWDQVLTRVKPLLKPGGSVVFDVLDPDKPLAEDWAILEMYLGAEVDLTPLKDWRSQLKSSQVKIQKEQPGELFHLFKVVF